MKNILIPSILEADTICAVKTAIKQAKGKNCSIILMFVTEVADSESPAAILRTSKHRNTKAQCEVLSECRRLVSATANCTLKTHSQCGMSAPLFKNLMEYLAIDLIVLCSSYKSDRKKINTYCNSLFLKCKSPILHIGPGTEEQEFSNALYIEYAKNKMGLQELQQLVNGQFNFKIVSQAKIEEQNPDDITPLLTEAITKNNIDLLIETRKAEKMKLRKKEDNRHLVNEALGLPVLSLYEEALEA